MAKPLLSGRNKSTLFLSMMLIAVVAAARGQATACKAGCSKDAAKVVVVHGFRSGAYAWWKVVFSLEKMGYEVRALDLKASGQDPSRISEVDTLDQYNEPLESYMAALPPGQRAVLVAHSAGGVSLTNILHRYPHKVAVAVYVAATMLKFNYLTCQDLHIGVPYFSWTKCSASCPKLPPPSCFDKAMPPDGLTSGSDTDETQDMRLDRMLARPGPYRAIVTSRIDDKEASAHIDMVPRVYVKTRLDRTLLPENQDAMVKLWPPCHVIDVNSDHDLLSYNPQLLAAIIANATSFYV